jgi:hypothetical protein
MDKNQLTTIVISAIAGALSKEAIGWVINSIKALSIIPAAYRQAKMFFDGPIGSIVINIFNLLFFLGILAYFGLSDGAVSRIQIIMAIVSVLMVLFFASAVAFQIGMELDRRKKQSVDQQIG